MIELLNYFAASCTSKGFFGIPTWYKYLDGVYEASTATCTPKIVGINDVWLIAAAVIDILLRIAALAAFGFVLYGGFEYITSQGEPDKTTRARHTIINALVGLVIAIAATGMVTFVAGRFNP